jgi:uncharacterized protein (DUF169 family)
MKTNEFLKELKLENKALSIILSNDEVVMEQHKSRGCSLAMLNRALKGETVHISGCGFSCPGAVRGFGFCDKYPDIKGGIEYFLSYGAGEGFPKGERIKNNPETAKKMLNNQPIGVLDGNNSIIIKPYEEGDDAKLVTFLAQPDQLSGLVQIFSYRTGSYENVIAPLCSGCASIFRIPLGELKRENPRGVIGNIDMVGRSFFDSNTFFFTIPLKSFCEMLEDADGSFLFSFGWKDIRKRL